MDYPHQTFILDDGCRPEIQALAKEMGIHYVTRKDTKYAKAGNINNALAYSNGDLIAFFDADGIPRRDFLTKLLGYFDDPKTALVQTPNAFYNLDSFQHWAENSGKSAWHEQALWYDVIQRGLDFGDAAVWCGSGSIIRRKALLEVGGVATETVTEDTLTTMNLHKAGYASVYHDEALAFSLAPATIEPYLVQRGRWALGSVQILRGHLFELIFTNKLSFHKKISFLMTSYYFTSIQKLFYYSAPFLYLAFDISPVTQPDKMILPLAIYVILSVSTFKILSRGTGRVLRGEVYFLHLIPAYLKAIALGLIPQFRGKFKVTSKNIKGAIHWELFFAPLVAATISIWGIIHGVSHILNTGNIIAGNILAMSISLYYLVVAFRALAMISKGPISLESYSFFDNRPIQIRSVGASVENKNDLGMAFVISESSVQLVHMGSIAIGQRVNFDLDLPQSKLSLEGDVRSCQPWANRGKDPLFIVEMKLCNVSEKNKECLSKYFFEDATPLTMNTTARIVREAPVVIPKESQRRSSERHRTMLPILLKDFSKNVDSQLGLLVDVANGSGRLKLPFELEVGSQIRVEMPWINKSVVAKIMRCKQDDRMLNPTFNVGITYSPEALLELEYLEKFNQISTSTAKASVS